MKMNEIRDLTIDEIEQKIVEGHRNLFESRFNFAKHKLDNTSEFKKNRHIIAQLKTVLREKELSL